MHAESDHDAWLIYDGECPFCRFYVKYLKVRESLGVLHLVDAREKVAIVGEMRAANIDLDKGMVLKIDDRTYAGVECIHIWRCSAADRLSLAE